MCQAKILSKESQRAIQFKEERTVETYTVGISGSLCQPFNTLWLRYCHMPQTGFLLFVFT